MIGLGRMRPRSAPSGHGRQARQRGAISLLVAISLTLLASLASFYSARSVLVDRLASHNQSQAAQARLAAEAALAWARAELQRQHASSPTPPVWGPGTGTAPCPAAFSGPRWQCVALQPPVHPGLPDAVAQVLAVRDLIHSPHVAQLLASASLKDGTSRAQVQAQVFTPTVAPAPPHPNTAAVVLHGCALAAKPSTQMAASNGTANTGASTCPTSTSPTSPGTCSPAAWTSVLGDISPDQIRAWSEAQSRNGLSTLSQPARSVYWVDSPATWSQSLGSSETPVLLVFSEQACAQRCPSMAPGVRVVGTVVLQTQCQDDRARAWHAGHIEGQLVVASGLPELQVGSRIEARELAQAPYRLPWPAGMDARQVQRVPGSWREGGP
ncbi:hypothetical protein [Limnohabitans sp.]|uniref:hypothetical protein n=1 Tax=Limnohabitans sp. TaxID=1907725 RepID=UPI0025BB12B0|nr:hypothetical protein [Limnohabitans sp.]